MGGNRKVLSFASLKRTSFDKKIKEIIGYWPKETSLYKLALRHASAYPFRKKKGERNNERMEFLGDAVIDLIVADILYYRFPAEDEGYLTKLRSKIVSRNNLNRVADELGLPNLVVANLKGNISESIYGDALEALIGALYLDHGIAKVERFTVQKIIDPFLSCDDLFETTLNYKSEVIEHFQAEKVSFRFEELERQGEQHNSTFTMGLYIGNTLVAKGEGSSKKKGEEAASRLYYEDKLSNG
ncbi:MAG: ribonuclease III [Flavobacteriales bacterium]|jgi:ribonuclease III|nr:ribonuclease III [Flavobacteriales bacterium]|tara:strand:- start:487 stop:1212 length:726 start_codon:yes stop_codon:yes gene_type:complete